MKDDKKIIKEVKRLQEIMGINKPLLLENPKLIADLIGTLARKEFTKFSKELGHLRTPPPQKLEKQLRTRSFN